MPTAPMHGLSAALAWRPTCWAHGIRIGVWSHSRKGCLRACLQRPPSQTLPEDALVSGNYRNGASRQGASLQTAASACAAGGTALQPPPLLDSSTLTSTSYLNPDPMSDTSFPYCLSIQQSTPQHVISHESSQPNLVQGAILSGPICRALKCRLHINVHHAILTQVSMQGATLQSKASAQAAEGTASQGPNCWTLQAFPVFFVFPFHFCSQNPT